MFSSFSGLGPIIITIQSMIDYSNSVLKAQRRKIKNRSIVFFIIIIIHYNILNAFQILKAKILYK